MPRTHRGFTIRYATVKGTTGRVTGADVTGLNDRPPVLEGDTATGLTVCVESEASRQACPPTPVRHPELGLAVTLDNPADDYRDAS